MSKEDRATHLHTADETVKNVFLASLKKVKKTDPKEAEKANLAGKMHDATLPVEHGDR